MDPLSDVLRAVRLTGAYFYLVEAAAPWSVGTAPARELVPRVLPDAEHLIAYHIVCEGECWAAREGHPPVRLEAGDVIIFTQGDAHMMMSHHDDLNHPKLSRASPLRYPSTLVLGQGPCQARFVCGFLGCDARPFNPLLEALPPVLHMPRSSDGWLAAFPGQVVRASRAESPGSEAILTRMAELMFVEVLRRYLATLSAGETGWLSALRDPVVGVALSRIHELPAHDWSLARLAREVGAGRSNLARRFMQTVGVPPMRYLAQWRLQVAADLLARGKDKVSTVASQVGYASDAAFSRAFKRATGVAPARWRQHRRAAEATPRNPPDAPPTFVDGRSFNARTSALTLVKCAN